MEVERENGEKREKRKRDKEFKLINVVVFGKYKKIVHECCSFQNQPWCAYYVSERSESLRACVGRPSEGARI
jgi:hypothetical protein